MGHDYATRQKASPRAAASLRRCVAHRRKSRYSESMSSLRDLLSRLSSIAILGDLLLLLRPARR